MAPFNKHNWSMRAVSIIWLHLFTTCLNIPEVNLVHWTWNLDLQQSTYQDEHAIFSPGFYHTASYKLSLEGHFSQFTVYQSSAEEPLVGYILFFNCRAVATFYLHLKASASFTILILTIHLLI